MVFFNSADSFDEIMNPNQAASFLQLSPKTLFQYSKLGQVPTIKKGKRRFYLKSQLIAYILGRTAQA